VLHVEDDPDLAQAVASTFEHLGFAGRMVHAATVAEGARILRSRRDTGEPVDLIVSDLDLPDGRGTEIVRAVKSNPAWAAIPVVMLSGDTDDGTVAEAYALGANSYVSKCSDDVFSALEAMFRFWIEDAARRRGHPGAADELLGFFVYYRARVSELFAQIARSFGADEERSRFWLGLSLYKANQASLVAFARQTGDRWVPVEPIADWRRKRDDRAVGLADVQRQFAARPAQSMEAALGWALQLDRQFDPADLAQGLSTLFPAQPAAAAMFRESVAAHLTTLAERALAEATAPSVRDAAERALAHARAVYRAG
jgi:CheY-like chemotaxis protein